MHVNIGIIQKTIPANKSNYIGVWEDDKYIGSIIFGLGASPSLGKKI